MPRKRRSFSAAFKAKDGVEEVFEGSSPKAEKTDEPGNAELYEQIGKLNMQLEWLKKKVAEHGG